MKPAAGISKLAAQAGKLDSVHPMGGAPVLDNHRLCVLDRNNGISFLIHTGANISVIPVSKFSGKKDINSSYRLYAANNTEIKTYGTTTFELDLGLQRPFLWTFVVCDVKKPILGADFLKTSGRFTQQEIVRRQR